MESDVCWGCRDKTGEIFSCDGCKQRLCKACGGLTSSEVRVLQLKERALLFHCKKCKNYSTFMLLQNIIDDKSSIIASKDEIIDLLKRQILDLEYTRDSTPPVSYSSVASNMVQKHTSVKENIVINNVPSLVIKPKQQQNPEKTEKDIRSKIDPSSIMVSIKGTRRTTNGNIVVKCRNRKDLETLRKEAVAKLTEYDVQMSQLRKPQVKIIGYKGDLDKNSLERSIRGQNQFINAEDELKIAHIRRNQKNNSYIIFVECSPSLYHKLMTTKKIFIGWERYPVYEDLRISRCFKCQEHYHKAELCENKVVCEYCSQNHDVRDCPKTYRSCVNCDNANKKHKTEYCTNHSAGDPTCPSYQYLINVLRSKIDYGNQI